MTGHGKPWFAAKRWGFGAGMPIAWQGWLLLLGHLAVLTGAVAWLTGLHPRFVAPVAIALAVLPMPIYAAKTQGGWRWRWSRGE